MKNFLAIVAMITFMGVSVYLLLNESRLVGGVHSKKKLAVSTSKVIGEKKRGDLAPYELQRMRIDSESTYKFESKNNNEVYELDEYELENFSKQLSGLNGEKGINHIDQMDFINPVDVSTDTKEKEYYEVDGQNL